jgi:hypothetical protein
VRAFNHAVTWSSRARIEFTFQLAIFITITVSRSVNGIKQIARSYHGERRQELICLFPSPLDL